MMVSLLILGVVGLLGLTLRKHQVITMILVILPFQVLLMSGLGLFVVGKGTPATLLSLWKEVLIVLLLARILIFNREIYIPYFLKSKPISIVFYLFLILVVTYFLAAPSKAGALVSFKNFVFPLMAGLVVSLIPFTHQQVTRLIRAVLLTSLVVFAVGHIQLHIMPEAFALFRGIADSEGSGNILTFAANAFTVMGRPRMYGSFVGPNELGLYTAIVLILAYYLYVYNRRTHISHSTLLVWVVMGLGTATLLQTFSRASWFFAALGVLVITVYPHIRMIRSHFRNLLLVPLPIFAFLLFLWVDFTRFIDATVSGTDLSAAARPAEFYNGFAKVISEPLGLGMGLARYGSVSQLYHSEIFWWITALEVGIIGFLLLISLYVSIAVKFHNKIKEGTYNLLTPPAMVYAGLLTLTGFFSAIVFEPIFLVYLWSFIGLGINKSIRP